MGDRHMISVPQEVYEQMVRLKGFLQLKEGKLYSMTDLIVELMERYPQQKADLDESMFTIEEEKQKHDEAEGSHLGG